VKPFRGAAPIGDDGGPLILLLEVTQLGNGSWRYAYSFAPGRCCYFTVAPGPAMVSPYDTTFRDLCRDIRRGYPASAR
jgi:hypothetical protein